MLVIYLRERRGSGTGDRVRPAASTWRGIRPFSIGVRSGTKQTARGSLSEEPSCERASEAPLSHQERAGRRSPYTKGAHGPGACRVREAEDVQGDGVPNVPHGVADGVLPQNGGPLLQAWGFYAPDLWRAEVAYHSSGKSIVSL